MYELQPNQEKGTEKMSVVNALWSEMELCFEVFATPTQLEGG